MEVIGLIEAECGRNGLGRGKSMHRGSGTRESMARGTRKNTGTEQAKEKGTKIYSNGLHDALS